MTGRNHHDGENSARASLSRILFFRHSPVKRRGVCYGQSQQETQHTAQEVAERFISDYTRWRGAQASRGVTRVTTSTVVWSSPAPRCMAPAQIIAEGLKLRHEVDTRLYEISFGDWEGRTWNELEQDQPDALHEWMEHWKTSAPPNGEAINTFQGRVAMWWDELSLDENHLLIGHAGVLRALLVNTRRQTWDQAMSLSIPHMTLLPFDELPCDKLPFDEFPLERAKGIDTLS